VSYYYFFSSEIFFFRVTLLKGFVLAGNEEKKVKKLLTAQKIGIKFEKGVKSALHLVLFPSNFISPFPSLSVYLPFTITLILPI